MTGHILPESTNACPTFLTTDIQPELLPCPFCGGEARDYKVRGLRGWIVDCTGCGASVHESDPQRVRLHWNTRLTFTTPTLGDMVMVPREPTEAMIAAAYAEDEGLSETARGVLKRGFAKRYVAMLSAAPASSIPISVNGAGVRERIARAIDPAWWAWFDRHGNFDLSNDKEVHAAKLAAADRVLALSPALDNTAVEGQDRRECQSVWRCAIGDFTGALDVLKNRWIGSRRKAEREAGAVLSGVLDLVWAARDPAAGCYSEAATNGKALIERVRAALAKTEKAR